MTNNDWQQFIAEQISGQTAEQISGQTAEQQTRNTAAASGSCIYDLSPLGVLSCSGADTVAFLQGQLSNDISQLTTPGAQQLSAYCNPKGRMLALFTVIKHSDDGYYLIAPQAVLAQVKGRLQMFIMRAKVSLSVLENSVVLGAQISAIDAADISLFCGPAANSAVNLESSLGSSPENRQPDSRFIVVLKVAAAIKFINSLPKSCRLADYLHWQTLDILGGLPQLPIELVAEFIPQSINLDLVGGVNFKKGCYPGQEIIARVKYRGKPKTRMLTVSIASTAAVKIGAAVFIEGKTASSGVVINVGASQNGATAVLISTPVSALEATHYLGSPDGAPFKPVKQAYAIP